MEEQITLNPPTRATMRMIFELALKGAAHPNTKQEIGNAYNYMEVLWMQEDQRRTEDDSQKPATPPSSKSAVERHGVDSKQAQAKRSQRKAQRQAAKETASQKPVKATESDDSSE